MSQADPFDFIEGSDQDGKPILLRVERYFYYNGEEYVLLRQVDSKTDEGVGDDEERLHVMRVKVSLGDEGEEMENFEPIEAGLMESLLKTVRVSFRHDLDEGDSKPV